MVESLEGGRGAAGDQLCLWEWKRRGQGGRVTKTDQAPEGGASVGARRKAQPNADDM